MSTIAVMHADLERSPIGTASRLTESLAGVPVLTRSVGRVLAAKRINGLIVTTPPEQHDLVSKLVAAAAGAERVAVRKFDGPAWHAAATVQGARKWALDSWRGGLGNTCFFDEHTHPGLALTLAEQAAADAVMVVPAEAPLLDATTLDAMETYYREEVDDDVRMVFAQAPPGLVPTLFSAELLRDTAQAGIPVGWINTYKPERPRADIITSAACFRTPLEVQHTTGRLTTDTRRGFERLQHLFTGGAPRDLRDICVRWRDLAARPEPLPREIQVELTTEDQHAATLLRPRGEVLQRSGCMDAACLTRLAEQAAAYDDVRVVLGGFGEPLAHPRFCELLAVCRRAGVFGIAVRTNGLALDQEACTALVDCEVDVVQVMIDALEPEPYRGRHGCNGFEEVLQHIENLARTRRQAGRPMPAIVPSMTKSGLTLADQDAFFDHWLSAHGWVLLEGYSHHAGLVADHRVMNMAPPRRGPCRQLADRLTVLADGRAVACDQDFQGAYVVGDLREQTLTDIWHGARLQALRQAQSRGHYDAHTMCPACEEWHRP